MRHENTKAGPETVLRSHSARRRNRLLPHLSFVVCLAFCFAHGFHLQAATLADLELVVDGCAEPPGDKLNLTILMTPKEEEIDVHVRGYVVSGADKSTTEPIRAAGSKNRDAEGRFLLSLHISRPADRMIVEASGIVPYEQLDLPRGQHLIAYEATGVSEGAVAFVRATLLSMVQITRAPRKEMLLHRQFDRQSKGHLRRAYLPGDTRRGGKAEPTEQTIVITKTTPVDKEEKVSTNIPAGFLRTELAAPRAATSGGEMSDRSSLAQWKHRPWYPLSEIQPDTRERVVHFATTRERTHANAADDQTHTIPFGDQQSDELTYGVAVVNFPVRHHQKGELESPTWWRSRDPEKYFRVESLATLARKDFRDQVRQGDVLLFVHGFRTTMESALLRAAQLRYDLEFPGACVAFSWPSDAGLTSEEYRRVAAATNDNVAGLAELLQALTTLETNTNDQPRPHRVHVIAHSLGNRLFLEAVWRLVHEGRFAGRNKYFGQVILAAPDVGAVRFNNLIPYVTLFSDQVTYYYCQEDHALKLSREINRYEPIGLMPFFDRGLDTINADGANTSFLGHSYFSSSPKVLMDMQLMLNYSLRPEARMPPLASRSKVFGHDHWSFTRMEASETARPR